MSYELDQFQQEKIVQITKEFKQLRSMFCNVSFLIDEQNYWAIRDKFQWSLREICRDDEQGDKIYYSTLALVTTADKMNKKKTNKTMLVTS